MTENEFTIGNGGSDDCENGADLHFHPKMPEYCCRCYIDLDDDNMIDRDFYEEIYYKCESDGEESLDKLEKLVLEGICENCYWDLEDGEDF